MSQKDFSERLRAAQERARQLKDKIEEHYQKVKQMPIRSFAEDMNIEPITKHSITKQRTLSGHFGKVYAMQWSQDAENYTLVSASQDGKLIVWNAFTTNKLHAIPLESAWVMTCAYSPDLKHVACGGLDNVCSIYSLEGDTGSGTPETELSQHDGYLSCARYLDANHILTASGDSTCILWDIATQTPVTTFSDHSADVMSVAVTQANPNVFVSGSCDITAKLWDIREGSCTQTFVGHVSDINSVDFFPDGQMFATGSDDSTSRLFDIRAAGEVGTYASDQTVTGITSLAFSKTGRLLFAGTDNKRCFVWDTLYQTTIEEDLVHDDDVRVSCVGVTVDGRAVCTGSWDTSLVVWSSAA